MILEKVSKLNTFELGVFFAWHRFLMNDKIILNKGSKIMVKSNGINFGVLGQVLAVPTYEQVVSLIKIKGFN